jgi:hypothetical protein
LFLPVGLLFSVLVVLDVGRAGALEFSPELGENGEDLFEGAFLGVLAKHARQLTGSLGRGKRMERGKTRGKARKRQEGGR